MKILSENAALLFPCAQETRHFLACPFGSMSSLACDVCSCDLISWINSRRKQTGASFTLFPRVWTDVYLLCRGTEDQRVSSILTLCSEITHHTYDSPSRHAIVVLVEPLLLFSRPVIGQRVPKLRVNIAPSWFGVHLAWPDVGGIVLKCHHSLWGFFFSRECWKRVSPILINSTFSYFLKCSSSLSFCQ